MTSHRRTGTLLAVGVSLAAAALLRGDGMVPFGPGAPVLLAPVISAGGSVDDGGGVRIVGQTFIGESTDGVVVLHAGAVSAFVRHAAAPEPPSGLVATVTGGFTIDLEWTDNSSDEESFVIERQVGAGPFEPLDVVPADQTTYTDFACSPDTYYLYRVCAVRGEAWSHWSNQVGALTPMAGDADMNGTVGDADFSVLLGSWGQSQRTWVDGDFSGNGVVGDEDFSQLLGNWGKVQGD